MILEVKEQISLRHESQTAKVALVPRSDFGLDWRRYVLFLGLLLDRVAYHWLESLLLIIPFLKEMKQTFKRIEIYEIEIHE